MEQMQIEWALRQKCPTGTAKAVLIVLVCKSEFQGTDSYPCCMVKHSDLATKCSVSLSSTKRAIKALEADGLIKKIKRWKSDGSQDWNKYEILMDLSDHRTEQTSSKNSELRSIEKRYPQEFYKFWFDIPRPFQKNDEMEKLYSVWAALKATDREIARKTLHGFYQNQIGTGSNVSPIKFIKDHLWEDMIQEQ